MPICDYPARRGGLERASPSRHRAQRSRGSGRTRRPQTLGFAQGERLGGYVIEEVAGIGGMGVVYRAHDPELGRTVAVKLIAPDLAALPHFRALFRTETQAAAALEHPHVLPVHRAGEDAGRPYLAMRYVEGVTLR